MEQVRDFLIGTGLLTWLWLTSTFLNLLSILLFGHRQWAAWLIPLALGLVSVLLAWALGIGHLGGFVLLAVILYGLCRWLGRRDAGTGRIAVRHATKRDWSIGAVLVLLFAAAVAPGAQEMLAIAGPPPFIQVLVLTALQMVVFVGFAHGIIESWWIGGALAAADFVDALVALDGPPLHLGGNLIFAVALAGLYVYGHEKWRQALRDQLSVRRQPHGPPKPA